MSLTLDAIEGKLISTSQATTFINGRRGKLKRSWTIPDWFCYIILRQNLLLIYLLIKK